jgi:TRAP-type mannitol/chloroaromatic compound transport system substrate-binding protein
MNPEGMAAWYHQGDGFKLWEEAYTAFNLVPRQSTTYAPQMAGWFRKKMTTIADYNGLKMRIGVPLGGKVYGGRGARRSSSRAPISTAPSSGASSTPPNGSGRTTT